MSPAAHAAAQLAGKVGRNVDAAAAEALAEAIEIVQLRRELRRAARINYRAKAKTFGELRHSAEKLVSKLENPDIAPELSSYFGADEIDIDAVIAVLRRLAAAAELSAQRLEGAESIDLGRPVDELIQELADVAREHLSLAPTTPGEPPGGPFVEFVQDVFASWGETPPSGSAIKSALYRAPVSRA
jgi:hypothetical protein